MTKQGVVFNIQRFSIHDGPGIRTTVFLKGCSMGCFWCHNPEGRRASPELQYDPNRCIVCAECVKVCPNNAHEISDGKHIFYRERCETAAECVDVCWSNALELVGETMTVEQIIQEVLRDRPFYESSNGGVTLSGGEPALKQEFSYEILKQCKAEALHTAIETCGNYQWENLAVLLPVTDLVMMDLKLFDVEKHRDVTGVSNERIFNNARRLAATDKPLIFRTPIVPTVNDGREEFNKILSLIRNLIDIRQADTNGESTALNIQYELLPFHKLAADKYRRLDMEYRVSDIEPPSKDKMLELADLAKDQGIAVKIR